MPLAYPQQRKNGSYTYGDYLTWPPEEKWEIIEGIAYRLGPAPSRRHQKVVTALVGEFYNFFKGKDCEVYGAPFDVRLPSGEEKDEEIKTVVQPDIAVICDKAKLDERGCKGSPDLIVEVTSPGTASFDYIKKLALYEKHGVKEYWLVHPTDEIVMVYRRGADGKYGRPEIYARNDRVKVGLFENFYLSLEDIFTET